MRLLHESNRFQKDSVSYLWREYFPFGLHFFIDEKKERELQLIQSKGIGFKIKHAASRLAEFKLLQNLFGFLFFLYLILKHKRYAINLYVHFY